MIKLFHPHWRNLLGLALCLLLSAGCTKASKARRLLAAAERDFQAQKYDTAEIEYKSVLRLSPLNPAAIRRLGFIYYEEGRAQSYAYLKKALEQDPKNPEVQLKLAETDGGAGQFKEAVALLGLVLKSEPGNERALVLLAQLSPTNELSTVRQRLETQLREGGQGAAACRSALGWVDLRTQKFSDAETEFRQASALDPKLASPFLGLAALASLHKDAKALDQALKTAAALSPIRSAARLKYADFKTQTGAVEEAKEMLRDITHRAPDFIPAWLDLMRVAFAQHKYDECQNAIDKILARDNSNFEATLQSGVLALAQRDASKALSLFQRLDGSYANMPEVKYHLALARLMNNEKQKAIALLGQSLALDRNYAPAVFLMAELDVRSGELSEAVTLLSQLLQNHPDNTQAQLALAEAYLAQQRTDRALEVYQHVARLFPKNAEIPRRMGLVYELEHDEAKARSAFDKSLDLAPDYLPTLQQITELDIYEKRFPEAHRRLAAVMGKNPKAAEPMLLQGRIYWAEGQTNQAESALSKAIELNPELPAAYLGLAKIYLASHQEQQALDRLGSLVARTNDLSAMLQIGQIHQTAGRYEQAREAYEKLLAVNPKFVTALNNLAYVDSEYLGKLDQALQLAETARQLRPYDPYTADTLGWILFKKHQYAHALSLIQESADKQPNDPEVQMHLGLAYYMMEEEKPARVCLERAAASHADFQGKELARRRLEVLNIDPATATPAKIQALQSLLHDLPQDPVLLSRLASIQEQAGDVQKAADSLQSLISFNPQDWSAMIRLSRLYAGRLNDLRKALELANSAHALAPDDGGASALLGELVFRSGDYRWALSLLEQAANQSSDQPAVFYHLALAYYAAGRATEADAAMQKAVQQGGSLPYLDDARQFLALRAAAGDATQAQASGALARKILDKDPNYVPALMVSALLAERRGAVDEAGQTCQKVLSIYPAFSPAMRQLAILYSHSQRASDLDKAYQWAEKARASMPDDLELAKTLGLLAYHRADYNRSLPLLRQCAEKSGADGEAFYYLGMDYYQLKQRNQSKQALQRALDLHVPDTLAAQARRILTELK